MDFSLEGKEKVVARGKFDNGFLDEMLENFGLKDFVLIEILVGVVLV
jgi:hypothetical protein